MPERQARSKGEVVLHPERLRILLMLSGRRMTTRQLANALPDIAQASLYRHVSLLHAAEILQVVDQVITRGQLERVFMVSQEAATLRPEEISALSKEELQRHFTTFAAILMEQFRNYLQQPTVDAAKDGLGFSFVPAHLTDAEYEAFRNTLRSLIMNASETPPAPGRRRRLLTTVVIPDPQEE